MGSSFESLRMSGLGTKKRCIRSIARASQGEREWEVRRAIFEGMAGGVLDRV